MPDKIDLEVKKRRAVKAKIDNIKKKLDDFINNPLTADELADILQELDKNASALDIIQDHIYEECVDDGHITAQVEIAEQHSSLIKEQKKKAAELLATFRTVPIPTSTQSNVKLPKIELPAFDGRYENWSSFQDLFLATIDNNKTLSGAQKLQYLKSTLKGEPATLIKSLQVTDQNYTQAWGMLTDRYDNEREIVTCLLRKLFAQPSLNKESSFHLQKLLDTTNECVRTLNVLKRSVEYWDDILVFFVVERMDSESRRHWAMSLTGTNMPTFKDLTEFLDKHIRGLLAGGNASSRNQQKPVQNTGSRNSASSHHGSTSLTCPHCKDDHFIFQCKPFISLSPAERLDVVKKHHLCYNCLRSAHGIKDCKSKHKCRKCNRNHNTLIHIDKNESSSSTNQNPPQSVEQSGTTSVTTLHSDESAEDSQVLLATALVKVKDNTGVPRLIRIFLDDGSQATIISENCAKSLGLQRTKSSTLISGIGGSSVSSSRGQVKLTLLSCINDSKLNIQAQVLPKVTGILPNYEISSQGWSHINGLRLADPSFYKPGQIDILLGADYSALVRRNGKRFGPEGTALALNTSFGWVLQGRVGSNGNQPIQINHVICETEQIMQRFWELEEIPNIQHLSPEEKLCETHFMDNHYRTSCGRYGVHLPFNNNISKLGLSREAAVRRLKQVERRLTSFPDKKQQYCKFMQEFLDHNHMEKVPEQELTQQAGSFYYLPHHCVIKDTSSTTKLRVVFDGSSKSSTGLSLNDCLMVGATVQDDLYTLLLRFRIHVIALKADIAMFYRQFEIVDRHRDYQRILWRDSPDLPIQDYRLTRVTYGTAAGSYLATRCLNQLAKDEQSKLPSAARVLESDFYVDDLLSGESTTEKAIKLYNDLSSIVKLGGMQIRKWSSNSPTVLAAIPTELRETEVPLSFDQDKYIKALGVQWQPASDCFTYSVSTTNTQKKITKRVVLSELSKVFDPLGFLSPVTITAKILFQELWKLKLDWDDELSTDLQRKWINYYDQLQFLSQIAIPRCIVTSFATSQELHGFSDASLKAYSAVVYVRNQLSDGSYLVRLVTAKTKVSPVNQVSIPRLELCGALLLAKLMTSVISATHIQAQLFAWTDSTVVLHWLASYPARWKTFVANRVAEIQNLVPFENWQHVSTEENPADCGSRGLTPLELKEFKLWWGGPSWLHEPTFPKSIFPKDSILATAEEKTIPAMSHHLCLQQSLVLRYSNLIRLKRVSAYCFRFIYNCKSKSNKKFGELSCDELDSALLHWVRHVQESEFSLEFKSLKSINEVNSNSKLQNLLPFIDSMGILRVGGRLHHANIPENIKHPIILPSQHHLTKIIIQHYHIQNLHAGVQLLLATLQQQYWIVRAKDTIRHLVRRCVICRRQRAATAQQLMGSLPSARVNPGRPFKQCGIDYAGPYTLKVLKGRGTKAFKSYICLFVCLSTKAIHLEAVSDLSTNAFLAALRRFTSRRGLSTDLYSDCGSNFIGADKELKSLLKSQQHNTTLSQQLSTSGINWHFNAPGSPHHGGLWEAGVKSVKFHLKRIVGTAALNFEEFQTFLCQIEACLNSRPLCALSTDPSDYSVLTPGHFIIGEPLNAIPEPDLTSTPANRLSKWQYTQQLTQHFWNRWNAEYITNLQQRFKWKTQRSNLQVNDLVIIKDESQPPMKWKLGRITEVYPGKDGHVRIVNIKTATSEFKRPISKLCPILQESD